MTTRFASARAWIELARLSNAPTVVSNVLVGLALGVASAPVKPPAADLWISGVVLSVAVLLLYTGGMALNDAADARVDAQSRPSRPVPSGRISRRSAFVFAIACILAGAGLAVAYAPSTAPFAGCLVAAIVLYDFAHKRYPVAAPLMGACRGLVYLTAAASVVGPDDVAWGLAVAIFLYISLVTVGAQVEDTERPGPRRLLLFVAIIPALLPGTILRGGEPELVIVTWVLALLWLLFAARHALLRPGRRTIELRRGVMGMLAGICLIDAHYLALLGQEWWALGAAVCFGVTALGHQRILGS